MYIVSIYFESIWKSLMLDFMWIETFFVMLVVAHISYWNLSWKNRPYKHWYCINLFYFMKDGKYSGSGCVKPFRNFFIVFLGLISLNLRHVIKLSSWFKNEFIKRDVKLYNLRLEINEWGNFSSFTEFIERYFSLGRVNLLLFMEIK